MSPLQVVQGHAPPPPPGNFILRLLSAFQVKIQLKIYSRFLTCCNVGVIISERTWYNLGLGVMV